MMKKTLFAALMLGAALSPLAAIAQQPTQVVTQLPRNARPVHYAINFTPDAANLKFTGKVAIDLDLVSASTSITLNAVDMVFKSVRLTNAKGQSWTPSVTFDNDAQTATLRLPSTVAAGRYRLDIDYEGKIYTLANGLFALDYKDPQGSQKRALFTQFEAPDARRFVPSWDEPNFRTSFDLTATVPADQMAVGNMPIAARRELGNGLAEVRFQTTPRMSTYLLFFGLGELERITTMAGKTEVGVVMGKGNASKARYALEAAAKVLPYYNDYFGTPFPLPKLDNVAGPGQSQFFSAMENWGAIFTFERVLLNDPKITGERARQAIFAVAGHEIAHQWFGDLVTMQWWDDLWLNEGFASWMETKATDHFNPDWQALLDRVNGREAAMGLDAYATTHPVIQKIRTVEETSQAFDAITYQKGEAVITMLEGFAGEDTWRSGIRAYMKKHAYGNTRTDDLWRAVEGAGGKGITRIAHDFTKLPGIPLVTVTSATCTGGMTKVSLTQDQFSRDQKNAAPLRWAVPIVAQIGDQKPVRTILTNGAGGLTLPGCGPLLVNAGQSGYYRTLYKPEMLAALTGNFAKLKPIDQMGLLHDNFALAFGDYQPIGPALDILGAIPADTSQKVLIEGADRLVGLYDMFNKDPAQAAKISAFASRKYGTALARIGYAAKPGEPALDGLLRSTLIANLGEMGDPGVAAEAKRLFDAWKANPDALDGPLKTIWLAVIARNVDQAGWDYIRAAAQRAENQVTKSALFGLLGAAKDPALAKAAMALALTDEPGPTISSAILSEAANQDPDTTVDFVLANLARVNQFVDVSSQSRYVAGLAGGSHNPAMIGKLDAFAKASLAPTARKPVDRAIARIKARLEMEPRVKPGISAWFAARGE